MGLMKKLTSAIVASSLVLGSVGMAIAAPTAEQVNTAAERMAALNLVKGRLNADGTTDLALDQPITRAELLKVVIMGLGYTEENVNILKGAPSFSDVDVNEWYAPYIALAKNVAAQSGVEVGYPDGMFRPNNQVTAAEALVFIMKLLGITPVTGDDWIQGNIALAVQSGLLTEADAQALLDDPSAPATRGLVFTIVDTAFDTYTYPNGKTVYQQNVDKEAPALTVNQGAPSVQAASVEITGKVSGAVELYAGTDAITFDAEGNFSYTAALEVGKNTITFTAKDLVGNTATYDYVVERTVGAAANVAVEIANQIVAGSEVEMKISVTDASGAAVEVDAESLNVAIGGNIGTYADGKFKASEKAGKGTITVTYGDLEAAVAEVEIVPGALAKVEAEKASVKPGEAVKLLAKDAYGNVIAGAVFAEDHANAVIDGDIFIGTKAGSYTVTAKVGDGEPVEGIVHVYGAMAGLKVEAPESLVGNNKTKAEVKVYAVDESGNVVGDYDGKIAVVDADTGIVFDEEEVAAKNGVATFKFKAQPTLADTDVELVFGWDEDENGTVEAGVDEYEEASAEVAIIEQVATGIKIDAPEYLPTTSTSTPTEVPVVVVDQVGEKMLDGAWEISFSVSGPAVFHEDDEATGDEAKQADRTIVADPDQDDFIVLYPEDAGDAGQVTITASFPGLESATATLKAAYPQAPRAIKVVAEDDEDITVDDGLAADDEELSYATYTITVVDRNGVPANASDLAGVTANIIFKDAADETYVAVLEEGEDPDFDQINEDGEYLGLDLSAGTVKIAVATEKAGTLSFVVEDDDDNLTKSASISTTFVAADPAAVKFTVSRLFVALTGDATATVSAQLYDEFDNKAAKADVSLEFGVDTDTWYKGLTINGKDKAVTVKTDATGKASATIKVTRTLADKDLVLSVSNEDLGDAVMTVIPTWVVASKVDVAVKDATSGNNVRTITAGQEIVLEVTVKDSEGFGISDLTAADFKVETSNSDLKVKLTGTSANATLSGGADGVYEIEGIAPEESGSLTFTVSVPTVSNDVKASRTISVKAAAPYTVALSEDEPTVKKDTVTEFTVQVVDEFGNAVTPSSVDSSITVDLWTDADGGSTYGEFRDSKGLPIDSVTIKAGSNYAKFWFVTNKTGEFTIVLTPTAADPAEVPSFQDGDEVVVYVNGYEVSAVDSVAVAASATTVKRDEDVTITVTVEDEESSPVLGAAVTLTVTDDEDEVVYEATRVTKTNGQATFTFALAEEGTYTVTASAGDKTDTKTITVTAE